MAVQSQPKFIAMQFAYSIPLKDGKRAYYNAREIVRSSSGKAKIQQFTVLTTPNANRQNMKNKTCMNE